MSMSGVTVRHLGFELFLNAWDIFYFASFGGRDPHRGQQHHTFMAAMQISMAGRHRCREGSVASTPPAVATLDSCGLHAQTQGELLSAGAWPQGNHSLALYPMGSPPEEHPLPCTLHQPSWVSLRATRMWRLLLPNPASTLFVFHAGHTPPCSHLPSLPFIFHRGFPQ